jgi:hypothetical protein
MNFKNKKNKFKIINSKLLNKGVKNTCNINGSTHGVSLYFNLLFCFKILF